ncbi:MAG: dipeptide epimerase, partial [Alphaproteobacteria bacterium]
LKIARDGVLERVAAVRRAAPDAMLSIDANESWDIGLLRAVEPALWDMGVRFVEQPLPAGADAQLAGLPHRVRLCADESCHSRGDLARLAGLYDIVNIKLDKAGGLTEAAVLMQAARATGMGVMLGCMVATSLSMAPALVLAGGADFVDLDGPTWLAGDRPGGMTFAAGRVHPPAAGFWGG